MLVDKEKALEVGNLIVQAVNDWIVANGKGAPSSNDILSALLTAAANLVASEQCANRRAELFNAAVRVMMEGSNAPCLVSVLNIPDNPGDVALATMPAAGRA